MFLCTTHSPLPAGSLMRYRICMLHIQVERISHWWQQCWSIKDSTFYPENSANSGGQLTPLQPGSEMSWRFLPCGRCGWPQSRKALCWCIGLHIGVWAHVFVCLREKIKVRILGRMWDGKRKKSCVCVLCWQAGSKRCSGTVLCRVIMHNLKRVHSWALWVFVFVLAVSFFFFSFCSYSHEWNI